VEEFFQMGQEFQIGEELFQVGEELFQAVEEHFQLGEELFRPEHYETERCAGKHCSSS